MKAKQKAKDLFDKYYLLLTDFNENSSVDSRKNYSKKCALIEVDEIIKSSPSLPIDGSDGYFGRNLEFSIKWWKKVRKELKILKSNSEKNQLEIDMRDAKILELESKVNELMELL